MDFGSEEGREEAGDWRRITIELEEEEEDRDEGEEQEEDEEEVDEEVKVEEEVEEVVVIGEIDSERDYGERTRLYYQQTCRRLSGELDDEPELEDQRDEESEGDFEEEDDDERESMFGSTSFTFPDSCSSFSPVAQKTPLETVGEVLFEQIGESSTDWEPEPAEPVGIPIPIMREGEGEIAAESPCASTDAETMEVNDSELDTEVIFERQLIKD